MSAVVYEAFSVIGGMKLVEVEWGLIKGYCCLFKYPENWWFGKLADAPEAIKEYPQADSIAFYDTGDLAALRKHLKDAGYV